MAWPAVDGLAGGFNPPTSAAATDLFNYWGATMAAGGIDQQSHHAALAPLAAGMLTPQLPSTGGGPTPPWLMPPTSPAPVAPPAPTLAPLAEEAAPLAGATPALEIGAGIGLADVVAPLTLLGAAGYGTYLGYKAVKDPSFHEGSPAMGTGPKDMGVDEPPPASAPGDLTRDPLAAPAATNGGAALDTPGSTPAVPASAPGVEAPVPLQDPTPLHQISAAENDSDAANISVDPDEAAGQCSARPRYVPKDAEGNPLPLPRGPNGELAPSSEYPHSQIGCRDGRRDSYLRLREDFASERKWPALGSPLPALHQVRLPSSGATLRARPQRARPCQSRRRGRCRRRQGLTVGRGHP